MGSSREAGGSSVPASSRGTEMRLGFVVMIAPRWERIRGNILDVLGQAPPGWQEVWNLLELQ